MKIIDKHPEYICKYNKAVSLPAIAFVQCDECQEYLCPSCGYAKKDGNVDYRFCNECWKSVEDKRIANIKL